MVGRGARSRRATYEASRRSTGSGGRRSGGSGGARAIVLLAVALALLGIGFGLGRWTARRGDPLPFAVTADRTARGNAVLPADAAASARGPAPANEVADAIEAALPADDSRPSAPIDDTDLPEATAEASPIAIV